MRHPRPLFHLCSVLTIHNNTNLPQINVKNVHLVCGAGIQIHDLLSL